MAADTRRRARGILPTPSARGKRCLVRGCWRVRRTATPPAARGRISGGLVRPVVNDRDGNDECRSKRCDKRYDGPAFVGPGRDVTRDVGHGVEANRREGGGGRLEPAETTTSCVSSDTSTNQEPAAGCQTFSDNA